MKYALPGAWLLCLASMSVMAQVDCSAYTNAVGIEPAGYSLHCRGHAGSASKASMPLASTGTDAVTAYAIQLTEIGDAAEQGLYAFTLPDFASATLVPGDDDWTTSGLRNLAYDPAASRLYILRSSVLLAPQLAVLDPTGPRIVPITSLYGLDSRLDRLAGFAINPRNGEAWLTTNRNTTNNPPLSQTLLWRLDLTTGNATYVGFLLPDEPDPVMVDIAIDCSGQMYGHNISDDSIYHINTNDLTVTRIGSHGLPANFAQGMDFDRRDGSLYAWMYTGAGDNQFGTVDLETGTFAALSQNSPRGEWIGAIPSRCAAMPIQDLTSMDGAWYNPLSSGQGFTLRYFPDNHQVFMPWFTFTPTVEDDDDDDGDGDDEETPTPDIALRWFTIEGEWEPGASEMVAPIVVHTGGRFNQGGEVQRSVVGEARLSFLSCQLGLLEYDFTDGELAGRTGAISLSRNLPLQNSCREFNGQLTTVTRPYDPNITGTWYDPGSSGQGLEITRIAKREADEETDDPGEEGLLFGAWFTYDPDSASTIPGETQHWFSIQGQTIDEDEPDLIQSTIYLSIGGTFDDSPAFAQRVVGTATLRSISCDRLKLSYEFEDTESALEFRDMEGEIDLHRLGLCPSSED